MYDANDQYVIVFDTVNDDLLPHSRTWASGAETAIVGGAYVPTLFVRMYAPPTVMRLGTVFTAQRERHAGSGPILPPWGRCVGRPDDVFSIATRRQRWLNLGLARPLRPSPARRLHPDKKRRDGCATRGILVAGQVARNPRWQIRDSGWARSIRRYETRPTPHCLLPTLLKRPSVPCQVHRACLSSSSYRPQEV